MSLTYPAAFVFQNAADTATITASGSLPLTPPSLLQTQHTGERWRVESDTAYLTVAMAAATTIDTFGLFGVKAASAAGVDLTSSIVSRVRASLTDASAQDGAVFDSASAAGRVSAYYNNLVCLRDGAASALYIRFDLAAAGAAYLEAGFTMLGLHNQALINFAYGEQDTPVDPSIVTTSRSGADWIDDRNIYREWDFNFEALRASERFGWVEDMDHLIGIKRNVMMIRNCASSNLGRDTLCGRIVAAAPVISRDGFIDDDHMYSKTYKIKQRQ